MHTPNKTTGAYLATSTRDTLDLQFKNSNRFNNLGLSFLKSEDT